MALENTGSGAGNRAPAAKVLEKAIANKRVAAQLVKSLGSHYIAAAIVGTTADTTTDFAALKKGDMLIHIPAVAGNADWAAVAADATSPEAAVVGDLYVALRAVALDSDQGGPTSLV